MLNSRRAAVLGLALALAPVSAHAADETRVATAFEENNPFDIFFSVGWKYENKLARPIEPA